MNTKWDSRFLELAKHIAQWSKDPSTKVGAVIVDENNRIVSVGYNGFARGVHDTEERLNDRETKYKLVVHGEINALLFATKELNGCTLYTWPFMPCANCAGAVIQSGITRVVAPMNDNPRWQESFELTKAIFGEAKVQLDLYGEMKTTMKRPLTMVEAALLNKLPSEAGRCIA